MTTYPNFSGAPSVDFSARLAKMYAALSASNEAILRAKSKEELYQWVCDAAVHGSKFSNANVLVAEPDSPWVRAVASAGVTGTVVKDVLISVDPSRPEGCGTVGTAFRTQQPCFTNDFLNDPKLEPWHAAARKIGWNSAAVFPLIVRGQTAGLLAFNSFELNAFEDEIVKLLGRVADNVSFALENFLREEERFQAEKIRLEAEKQLRDSEERFRSLTNLSSDWYWELDDAFCFTRLEGRTALGDGGISSEGCIGKARWECGLEAEDGWDAHRSALLAHHAFRDTILYRRLPDGSKGYIAITGEPIYDGERFIGYRGIGRDVTIQKRDEERIRYLANHDVLTGLPNRMMFSQLLNRSIESARRYQRNFAVMFFDLDRFKLINDTLGHEAGDILLKEAAARVAKELRTSDVIARLGGDEFVILIQEVSEKEQVAVVAKKVLSAISKLFILCGQECRVTASIGICMFPSGGADEQSLMKNADIAMYLAKEQGKNNYQFYSEALQSMSFERLSLEANLRQALERQEFYLDYQPKLDLATGLISGVEALLRWRHPTLGVVMPSQFIPLAEETGLIIEIGRWVIQEACRQNITWQADGLPSIRVAVNLSARQFFDENLAADVQAALEKTGVDPAMLELEITEGMAMQNIENAVRMLKALKAMGVRIALDDFGTGYSSLAQIKRFPIDTLKVDRSFIRDLGSSQEDRAITEAIIAMGRTLSLTVVAEGVETKEQESFLREKECDESQGYLFSKPTSAEQFEKLFRRHLLQK